MVKKEDNLKRKPEKYERSAPTMTLTMMMMMAMMKAALRQLRHRRIHFYLKREFDRCAS